MGEEGVAKDLHEEVEENDRDKDEICILSSYASVFVAFVEDNANMSSIGYFENHVSWAYFVQNRRK